MFLDVIEGTEDAAGWQASPQNFRECGGELWLVKLMAMVFVLFGVDAAVGNGFRVSEKCFFHSLREMKCFQDHPEICSWIYTNIRLSERDYFAITKII